MADFNELKAIIEEAIQENGREEITGDILQGVLLSIVDKLGDEEINTLYELIANEVQARQDADVTLQGNIDAEERRASAAEEANAQAIADEEIRAKAEEQLNARNITAEEVRAKAAEKVNADDIDVIESKIPAQASAQNQLADKQYVDDKVATDTATFRGTYNLVTDLELTTSATQEQIATALAAKMSELSIVPDNNDYSFVQIPTSDATPTEIARIDRYKYNGSVWAFEYSLNNSGFTAAQWAAINSGITGTKVTKLDALPTNTELTTLLNGKANKSEMSVVAGTGTDTDKTTITLKTGTSATVLTTHQNISGKEDKTNKVTTITSESTDTQYGSAKSVYTLVMSVATAIREWANNIFAKIDGYYETMVVGAAKNLEGHNITEGTFFARPTGGENSELANGLAQIQAVKGNSVKYNQLVQNGNFANGTTGWHRDSGTISVSNNILTYTVTNASDLPCIRRDFSTINGHKYYLTAMFKNVVSTTVAFGFFGSNTVQRTSYISIVSNVKKEVSHILTANSNYIELFVYFDMARNMAVGNTCEVSNIMIFDITALGIDNLTTVAQVEAWMAENWGEQEFYPFSNGSVLNVNMTGIESFKRNLLNPTTGKAYIIGAYSQTYGNYYGICGTHGTLTFKDAYGNESTITPDADGKFELNVAGELTVADAGADCAVYLWWEGTETEYSEYGTNFAKLDIPHIYGKKNGAGELVRVWPTGMVGVGNIQDYLKLEDGAVVAKRVMGEVDLGNLGWSYQDVEQRLKSAALDYVKSSTSNAICWKYKYNRDEHDDKRFFIGSGRNIYVYDSSYTDAATFKTAMAGVMLYYDLATPETYTDLVYMGSELFEDGTPVTLPVNYEADNWGIERVLPLNTPSAMVTAMPTIESKYSLDAVEQLDTHSAEIEAIKEAYVKRSTLAQGTGNSIDNTMSQAAITEQITALQAVIADLETIAEGYIRVAGSSSPALSYKSYKYHEQGGFGRESVFSLFYPCLVGTPLTGEGTEGKILHILNKLDYAHDIYGNARAIDGSEGDVMICNIEPYYRIIGKHTIDGTEYDVFLMSRNPFTWQGIEAERIDKFGWSPDYCVSHTDTDNVVRMHSVYNPAWNGSYQAPDSIVGKFIYSQDEETGDITEEYDATATVLGGAGGLHTTNIDLPTGEQRAMNNNADTTKTVPWMNATAAGAENLMALMLAEGGTFDAHNATLMGSGFSSNDPASAAADWEESGSGAKNGVRLVDKNNALKYYSLGTNAKTWTGKSSDFQLAKMINDWRNPFHVMEAHRAVCYAIQKGVHELEWFVFEGNKYKWRSVTGFASPAQGEMTCVLWKMLSSKCASNVLDPTDKTTSIEGNRIDFLISVALFHGMTTQVSPSWWTSGLIFTEDASQNYEAYMEREQESLIKSVYGDKATSDSWTFESQYLHVGSFTYGEGYRKNYSNNALMLPDTSANKSGAGLHTYVGAYNWFTGAAASSGKKSVRGFRRGYSAAAAALSPLAVGAGYAPSSAGASFAFGTCCAIED